ncbi:hypothetical protein [Sphingobacterium sp. JUb56]|uniref:hypothetical protein n=1 Tax=Sphingobacterium sp. JUb56 TaxID=2587145 RepID=UPI001608885A|nr:hypothetical protein [Sphingobacterium sp. JUb56]MBB2949332.1 hypothetical protein [Sphingobacterium sp. JUb56]
MNTINFIKKYALAMVAVATVLTFSAFKVSGGDGQQKRMTVAVYFHGNPTIPSQVENEALWNTDPNDESCNAINQKACMQLVEHTDLTGSNTLDPAKITLGSVNTGAGYVPTRTGGSSSTPFNPINRS